LGEARGGGSIGAENWNPGRDALLFQKGIIKAVRVASVRQQPVDFQLVGLQAGLERGHKPRQVQAVAAIG